MSRIGNFVIGLRTLLVLGLTAGFGAHHWGQVRYDAGYEAAVKAGQAQRQADATAARAKEEGLRRQLAAQEEEAQQKEKQHAKDLDEVQRRVLVGTDRLRCPAARAVQHIPAPATGPAPTIIAADTGGPDLVPEAAADVLGYGAAIAGLVRRYDRLTALYEQCRQSNNR